MARNATRYQTRHIPAPPPTIGVQPDMFGAPPVVHEAAPRPVSQAWGRQLLKYFLADTFADLADDAPPASAAANQEIR